MFQPKLNIVYNNLPELSDSLQRRLDALVAKAALDIEGNAKAGAPVDTGFLKNSIQATKLGDAHWRVTVGAQYGVYVNYGTWRTPARPFWDQAIGRVEPVLREGVRMLVNG